MTLIAIGGAEEKEGEMILLSRVLSEAKGAQSRIVVISSASSEPEMRKAAYTAAFDALGATCDVLHIANRDEAADPATVEKIAAADVIFFTGGDQSRLVNIMQDTPAIDAVRRRLSGGAVVAGTSAGAAAMSTLMITGGDPADAAQAGGISKGKGFGLMPDAVLDTHFTERGRLPRLFNAVSSDARKAGIGLDENTGLVIRADGNLEVIGAGSVTLVTGDKDGPEAFNGKNFAVTKYRAGQTFRLK